MAGELLSAASAVLRINAGRMQKHLSERKAIVQLSTLGWMRDAREALSQLVKIDAARRALSAFASSHWKPVPSSELAPHEASAGAATLTVAPPSTMTTTLVTATTGKIAAQQLQLVQRASQPERNAQYTPRLGSNRAPPPSRRIC